MSKRLVGVILAALLAVLGTIAILAYVNDADDRAQADVELVEVYVIEDRVSAGADEAELRGAIGTTNITAAAVVDGVVTDLTQLDGQVAAVDLVPGEQVLLSRLIDAAAYDNGRSRLTSVPAGLHEVTVSLEPARVVGGQLEPGDTVGVLASFLPGEIGGVDIDNIETTEDYLAAVAAVEQLPQAVNSVNVTHFLLHQVLVTRVQLEELPVERTDDNGEPIDTGVVAPTGNLLITLALDAADVQDLVFSVEFGTLWMTYEPLDSLGHDDLDATTRTEVFAHPHDDATTGDDLVSTAADPEGAAS